MILLPKINNFTCVCWNQITISRIEQFDGESSRIRGWGALMMRTGNVVSVGERSTEVLQHLVSGTIGLLYQFLINFRQTACSPDARGISG